MPRLFPSHWLRPLLIAVATAGLHIPARAAGSLSLLPCHIDVVAYDPGQAECGRLQVPEDRAHPAQGVLQLSVVRLPALTRQRAADALFVLGGDLGVAASQRYAQRGRYFDAIRRHRDLVLVDQRGTGGSQPLACPEVGRDPQPSDSQVLNAIAECRARLEQQHDLAHYTTSVAVEDLDAVREALGLARINLYADHYGTRVAQHYARRFPTRTRALILDGAFAPQQVMEHDRPAAAQAALNQVFDRCRRDPGCLTRFGDPAEHYRQLRAQLSVAPRRMLVKDEEARGSPVTVNFSLPELATALMYASASADRAAMLPYALARARQADDFMPLARIYVRARGSDEASGETLARYAVLCAEDVPYFPAFPDRGAAAQTYLGVRRLELLERVCKRWPLGPVDNDLHAALSSPAAALLLSGTADPVTPPGNGDLAARGFVHALHVRVPDQGEGVVSVACVDGLMARFLDIAEQPLAARRLDVSCATGAMPPPFRDLAPDGVP